MDRNLLCLLYTSPSPRDQRGSAGNNAAFYWNEGDDKFKAVLTTSAADASAVTDSSTATIVANLEGTASVATTVTVTDNESTNEENVVTFVAGADSDGGNVGLESDGNFTYNPSTGAVTATKFKGDGSELTLSLIHISEPTRPERISRQQCRVLLERR